MILQLQELCTARRSEMILNPVILLNAIVRRSTILLGWILTTTQASGFEVSSTALNSAHGLPTPAQLLTHS